MGRWIFGPYSVFTLPPRVYDLMLSLTPGMLFGHRKPVILSDDITQNAEDLFAIIPVGYSQSLHNNIKTATISLRRLMNYDFTLAILKDTQCEAIFIPIPTYQRFDIVFRNGLLKLFQSL